MKLATERSDSIDGRLVLVSRDLKHKLRVDKIAPTLQFALDHWERCRDTLSSLYDELNAGRATGAEPLDVADLRSPLPRAWQWLDGSTYPSHGRLMQTAFNLKPIDVDFPLMYQGMSHEFLGATDDVPFRSESDGIDFEGEIGVITGDVPMAVDAQDALAHIRLLVQINDWSLRVIAPVEMKTGFGWVQAKPACSIAPIAVTPDELGDAWAGGRLDVRLKVHLNDVLFGEVPARDMQYGFDELIAYAARTRRLCAGTVIGSGTVSSDRYRETGSCCIAERRAIEMIAHGAAQTPFLKFGDRVRMATVVSRAGLSPFGEIHQQVVRADDLGRHS